MLEETLINDRESTRYVENIILDAIRKKGGKRVYFVLYAFLKIPKKKVVLIITKIYKGINATIVKRHFAILLEPYSLIGR